MKRGGGPIRAVAGQNKKNLTSLYILQVFNLLIPILTVPYLARVVHPSAWGLVAFAQALAGFVVLAVDYGFAFSATRKIAENRESPAALADIVAGVQGAKVFLALLVGGAAGILCLLPIQMDPPMLFAALIWGWGQGFTMNWFYQGLEQAPTFATFEIVCRLIGAASLFILVRNPEDAWRILLIQGLASFCSALLSAAAAYRHVPFVWPQRRQVLDALRWGRGMLLFRTMESSYSVGSPFLLGLMAPAAAVGYFAGSERLVRTTTALLEPIHRAMYPRIVSAARSGTAEAAAQARVAAWMVLPVSIAMTVVCAILAPLLVRLTFGAAFAPAVASLRILSLLPAAITLKNLLGVQWMVPLGMESAFNGIILASGGLHLTLSLLLCPRLGHTGMALAVVAAECSVPFCMSLAIRKKKLSPFDASLVTESVGSNG